MTHPKGGKAEVARVASLPLSAFAGVRHYTCVDVTRRPRSTFQRARTFLAIDFRPYNVFPRQKARAPHQQSWTVCDINPPVSLARALAL